MINFVARTFTNLVNVPYDESTFVAIRGSVRKHNVEQRRLRERAEYAEREERRSARDTSSWNDIIARAVKSPILPTVKCPVITSGLPPPPPSSSCYFIFPRFGILYRPYGGTVRRRSPIVREANRRAQWKMRPIHATALDLISENDLAPLFSGP